MTTLAATLPVPRSLGSAPARAPRPAAVARPVYPDRQTQVADLLDGTLLTATLLLVAVLIGSVLAGAFA